MSMITCRDTANGELVCVMNSGVRDEQWCARLRSC
jgi:hypothetical protein